MGEFEEKQNHFISRNDSYDNNNGDQFFSSWITWMTTNSKKTHKQFRMHNLRVQRDVQPVAHVPIPPQIEPRAIQIQHFDQI
jgi:hypothetical protein